MKQSPNFNMLTLEGFLTHDPEYHPDKNKLLTFSIAHNTTEDIAGIDNPMYFDVRVTGVSEKTAKAIVKGHRVRATGKLQCKSWTGKEDGKKRYFFLYVPYASMLELLSKPRTDESEQQAA